MSGREAAIQSGAVLVLGGARSGKSRYAQQLAEAGGHDLVFIATAQASDEEMHGRIERHKADRGPRWRTVEAQLDLAEPLASAAGPDRVVLVDCLTLWLGNLLLADRDAATATRELAALASRLAGPVVFVSNEVGLGIVPDTPLGRSFRDDQGRLNQAIAAACENVILITAGLPLQLKPREPPRLPAWLSANRC